MSIFSDIKPRMEGIFGTSGCTDTEDSGRTALLPVVFLVGLCAGMFLLGGCVGMLRNRIAEKRETKVNETVTNLLTDDSEITKNLNQTDNSIIAETAGQSVPLLEKTENWGLCFGKSGEKPRGDVSTSEMAKYNAHYMTDNEDKVLYLTFDCGYENGNTEPIMDALKMHNAPATFFVVGHFLESAPEIAKRMVEDGFTVGNHTYHHPDMSKIADKESFLKEVESTEKKFLEITGTEMAKYYRPPQGKYNTANLQMAREMGYTTFFWSLAYVDWKRDAQPTHEEAINKLMGRVHPGAIVLLHSTSDTNGEILDEVLTKWEELGYSFGDLADFVPAETTSGDAYLALFE